MKSNYLLVHGSFGSPFSNWLLQELVIKTMITGLDY